MSSKKRWKCSNKECPSLRAMDPHYPMTLVPPPLLLVMTASEWWMENNRSSFMALSPTLMVDTSATAL